MDVLSKLRLLLMDDGLVVNEVTQAIPDEDEYTITLHYVDSMSDDQVITVSYADYFDRAHKDGDLDEDWYSVVTD